MNIQFKTNKKKATLDDLVCVMRSFVSKHYEFIQTKTVNDLIYKSGEMINICFPSANTELHNVLSLLVIIIAREKDAHLHHCDGLVFKLHNIYNEYKYEELINLINNIMEVTITFKK